MSLAEIKAEVSHLSDEDLDELAACVRLARRARDPHWLERVVRINVEMDRGRAHSQEEMLRVHEELRSSER